MTFSLRPFALGLLLSCAVSAQSTSPSAPDLFGRLSDAERALLYAVTGVNTASAFRPGEVVGGLPFSLPALPGQVVIGSVVQPGATLVVLRTTATPEAAQATLRRGLAAQGWRDQYDEAGPVEVFLSSPDGTPALRVVSQCKPGVQGSLSASATAVPGGAQVVIRLFTFPGVSSTCPANLEWNDPAQRNVYSPDRHMPVRDPVAELQAGGLVLPSLPGPAGARVTQSGSQMSSESPTGPYYATYAIVRTALTPDAVFAHYLAALKAQGWSAAAARTGADGERTVALTARQGGQDRQATLALMPRPDLGTVEDGNRLNRMDVQFAVGTMPRY